MDTRTLESSRRRGGYLVGAGAFLGLAFATKENALVYVGMFVGATALLLDERLLTSRARGERWDATAHDYLQWAVGGLVDWRRALAGATGAFLVVTVFFYAPRPEFYDAFGDPALFPGVVVDATWGAWGEFWGTWGASGSVSREQSYVAFLEDAVRTLGSTSLILSAAAVLGFLHERYVADDPRDLVLFAGYWGVASLLVYPAITDISGHWSVTHAVVPLAIPAAVGFGLVVGRGRRALESDDRVGVALAAIVLLAAVAQVGVVTAETSFLMDQDEDNALVQFGQPGSDMRETTDAIESVAAAHDDGTDVLYFGDHFHVTGEYDRSDPGSVAGTDWFNRLPLAWYVERGGAVTDSTVRQSDVTNCDSAAGSANSCDAPVVVALAEHYPDLNPALEERGYESWTYELTSTDTVFVVWMDTDAPGYPDA